MQIRFQSERQRLEAAPSLFLLISHYLNFDGRISWEGLTPAC